jgi:hypothetical protein
LCNRLLAIGAATLGGGAVAATNIDTIANLDRVIAVPLMLAMMLIVSGRAYIMGLRPRAPLPTVLRG